jgi:hypothetical protein
MESEKIVRGILDRVTPAILKAYRSVGSDKLNNPELDKIANYSDKTGIPPKLKAIRSGKRG